MHKSLVCFLTGLAMLVPAAGFAQTTSSIPDNPSGLPLPRYVSLKAPSVNMRVGPGKQYAITWRYTRRGLPLEVIQEFDTWRRVRDHEGTIGWMHGSLLSGVRSAVTRPWDTISGSDNTVPLHRSPHGEADVSAYLKPGVIGEVSTCDGVWCEMTVERDGRTIKGFANQAELWGVYPDETFD